MNETRPGGFSSEALRSRKIGFNKALRFSDTEITKRFVPARLGMAGAVEALFFIFVLATQTVPGSNGKRFIARAE